MRRLHQIAIATLLCLSAERVALADRQEWRLSLFGVVGASSLEHESSPAWAFSTGGGSRIAYGVTNFLELGLASTFTVSPRIEFPSVIVENQPGNLFSTIYTVDLAVDARLIGGVTVLRAFARFHPIVGVRACGVLDIFSSQVLLDDQRRTILRPDDDVRILPAIAGYIGAEYRFARSWLVEITGTFTFAGAEHYSALGTIQFSYLTYGGR